MQYLVEQERQTPVLDQVDVLVCGGGFGGIAAALAAARMGKKTLLVEREFSLGGLGTLGLVTIYLPLCNGKGEQVSFGIAEELLLLSCRRYIDTHRHAAPIAWLEGGTLEEKIKCRYRLQYNPWFFAYDAEQLLKSEGVEMLFGTSVCDVAVENGKITHAVLDNIDGRTAVAVGSVVDATGSAVVAHLAGEETALFSRGNVPTSWYYFASKGKVELRQFGGKNYFGLKSDPETDHLRFHGVDARENSSRLLTSRERMMADLEALSAEREDPELVPLMIPFVQDLRMTRRIKGAVEFRAADVGRRCEESIGCIGNWKAVDDGHEIPYRSLYGNKIKNLITAGRCTAADDDGWDLTRVIPTCAVTGEAAGIAASMTDDFASLPVSELQAELVKKGVKLHLDKNQ